MARKSTLAEGVRSAAGKAAKPGPVAVLKKPAAGTVLIGAHYAPEVRRAMKLVRYGVPEPYREEA